MAQPVKQAQLKPKSTVKQALKPAVSAAPRAAAPMPAKMAAKMAQPVSAPKGKSSPVRNPIAAARNKGQQGALMSAANKRRQGSAATKGKQGGINIPKFAGEVSANYAKGIKALGGSLDKLPGIGKSRKASGVVSKTMKAAPGNRAALKKVLGK